MATVETILSGKMAVVSTDFLPEQQVPPGTGVFRRKSSQ